METKVVCPQCGAEFAIPATTHVVFGADSNLGVIHPEVIGQNGDLRCANTHCTSRSPINPINTTSTSKQMKASEKLAALAAAGVNVSNLFSMAGVTGEETLARVENGQLTVIPDDDPIFNAIMGHGTVPNNRLFRRWVMAQVFHMMTYKSGRKWGPEGFTAALNAKGFKYSWRMTVEEFRVQAKLERNDPENFTERNRWFNKLTVLKMCDFYLQELNKHINELKAKHLKKCKVYRTSVSVDATYSSATSRARSSTRCIGPTPLLRRPRTPPRSIGVLRLSTKRCNVAGSSGPSPSARCSKTPIRVLVRISP